MPLYEYRCEKCQRTFEVIQSFSDAELTECSECGGHLERLLSAPAIRFKGTGWYVTDYGGKNGNGTTAGSSTQSSSSAETKKEAKDGSKGKSKTESKSETKA
jgi:putative FmdB family regulatory protein